MEGNQDAAARKLMQAFLQFRRLFRSQSPIEGLRPSEIMVLHFIKAKVGSDGPGIKVSELSAILGVTPPTVTQMINGLVADGFVERSTDPTDRRAVRIRLTDKGQRALRKATDAFVDAFRGLAEYLGEEDTAKLAELLAKVFVYFSEIRKEGFPHP